MGTKREVKKACRNVPSHWCHRGDATSNTERVRDRKMQEINSARERKREKARASIATAKKKRGDTHGDQGEVKTACHNVQITLASQC